MALQSGMTYKEFWEDDPELFWAYRFCFYKKQEAELDDNNFKAWLNGLYVYNAISVSLANALRGKGDKAVYYLEEPINFNKKEKNEEEDIITKQRVLDQTIKDRAKQIEKLLKKKVSDNNGQK